MQQNKAVGPILPLIRATIASGWTKQYNARDALGIEADPNGNRATCWCLFGALLRHANFNTPQYDNINAALNRAVKKFGGDNFIEFNDNQESVEPILALLDEAIALHPGL